ncbi:hypothetical protein [Haloferula sargassicola]|uniref:Uncharacterized protein n=1 Tax=Haloferula sargassicola TaxID=490096 RepID=A0ABP9UT40_9BACT
MAERAKVASIEALEDFRSSLVKYSQRTKSALDEVSSEMKRLREWLSYERRTGWEAEVRRGTRRLEQAEAELMTAEMSGLQDDLMSRKMAVKKAVRALEESTAKLEATKRWARNFDSVVAPALRPLDSLRDRVAGDLPKAIATLDGLVRALEAYAERDLKPRPAEGSEEGGAA